MRWIWLVCSRVGCLRARSSERSSRDLLFRNKARLDQAAGRQIGNPGGVVDVGLAAGNVLDGRRIGHDQLEGAVAQSLPRRRPGMFHTGFQQTPVAAIATAVHPDAVNQPNQASRPAVVVSTWKAQFNPETRRSKRFFTKFEISHGHRRGDWQVLSNALFLLSVLRASVVQLPDLGSNVRHSRLTVPP